MASVLSCMVYARAAQAIDCAKAQSKIEIAICSDVTLKQKDEELSKGYFGLLRSSTDQLNPAERETLLSDQRAWLKRRDQICNSLDAAELRQCIGSAIDGR